MTIIRCFGRADQEKIFNVPDTIDFSLEVLEGQNMVPVWTQVVEVERTPIIDIHTVQHKVCCIVEGRVFCTLGRKLRHTTRLFVDELLPTNHE